MNHTHYYVEHPYREDGIYIAAKGTTGLVARLYMADGEYDFKDKKWKGASDQTEKTARFIVTACNAHEELIAMVKEFIQDYQEMGMGDKQAACNAQQLLTTIEKGS